MIRTWLHRTIQCGLYALCWATCAVVLASPAQSLEWSALQPVPQPELNPFEALSDAQTELLGQIAMLQVLQGRGLLSGPAAKAQRSALVQQLQSQGLDADTLMAQRDSLIEQRKAQAENGVKALHGQRVQLHGYLVSNNPASTANSVAGHDFLLVPWVGACSHSAPEPPNQTVRVHLNLPYALTQAYTAVRLEGLLELRSQQETVYFVDGALQVRSAYAMGEVTLITTGAPSR